MTILEMIAEWRKGCKNPDHEPFGTLADWKAHQEGCWVCTLALIAAIERAWGVDDCTYNQ